MKDTLIIRETTEDDLREIQTLWNCGEVMFFVGYPDGLGISYEELLHDWYPKMNRNNQIKHYSIYHKQLGYCGETYYRVDENGFAALDIKLHAKARGKGIALFALTYAIQQAFKIGNAHTCYVDPDRRNKRAIQLYKRLGFVEKEHPNPEYSKTHLYLEVYVK